MKNPAFAGLSLHVMAAKGVAEVCVIVPHADYPSTIFHPRIPHVMVACGLENGDAGVGGAEGRENVLKILRRYSLFESRDGDEHAEVKAVRHDDDLLLRSTPECLECAKCARLHIVVILTVLEARALRKKSVRPCHLFLLVLRL